jgi:hypothetical protein
MDIWASSALKFEVLLLRRAHWAVGSYVAAELSEK